MEFTIEINDDEIYEGFNDYNIMVGLDDEIILTLHNLCNKSYESCINNVEEIRKAIDEALENANMDKEMCEESIKIIEKLKKYSDEEILYFIKNAQYIKIEKNYEEIKEYIIKNNLKDKKILLPQRLEFNLEEYKKLMDNFKGYDNIYSYVNGNDTIVNINVFTKCMGIINDYVKEIKSMNLSPFEEAMYAYDLVRKRVYKFENINEDKTKSRDLTEVLLGNKIVCLGYSRIYKTILNQLNIPCIEYILMSKDNKRSGHAINLAYIKDDKYNINGLYYFDSTTDSKSIENDNYLNRYLCFAITYKEFNELSKNTFIDATLDITAFEEDSLNEICDCTLLNKDRSTSFKINSINTISRLIFKEDIIKFGNIRENYNINEEDRKTILKFKELFNRRIDATIYLKALYNVRKKEYYYKNYPFNLGILYTIMYYSQWNFSSAIKLKQFLDILKDETNKKSTKEDKAELERLNLKSFKNFIIENDLNREMSQIKLTKTLKNIKDTIE